MSQFEYLKVDESFTFKPFDCGDVDLNEFLLHSSKKYQQELLATTYVIENTTDTVAFFSIFNDSLRVQDIQTSKSAIKNFLRSIIPHGKRHLDNYPAVKIGRLGVSIHQQGQQIGTKIINTIVNFAINQNNQCGCKFVIVDAYKGSLKFYLNNHFVFLSEGDLHADTRQMYLNLTPYKVLNK